MHSGIKYLIELSTCSFFGAIALKSACSIFSLFYSGDMLKLEGGERLRWLLRAELRSGML